MAHLHTLLALIDTRSFTSIWYWVLLVGVWARAWNRVLGVPWVMVPRAWRHGGQAMADVEALAAVSLRRLQRISAPAAVAVVAVATALLALCGVLGWAFHLELAQALFLLAFPLAIVVVLSILTARDLVEGDYRGRELCARLARLRLEIQTTSIATVVVTAFWASARHFDAGLFGF